MPAEKAGKGFERCLRSVVFHALCVGLRGLGWNANSKQQLDHQPVPGAHAAGKLTPILG